MEVVLLSVDVSAEDAERSKYETKAQVADHLDVSRPRVTALIEAGVLETKEFDGRELVSIASAERYRTSPRKAGGPMERKLIAV